jgi:hypothetical protein
MSAHAMNRKHHVLVKDPLRIHEHARAALARAVFVIETLQRQAMAGETAALRQQRLLVRGAVRDLELRYRDLAALHAGFANEQGAALAAAWQRFFNGYDDFLEAARRARNEVARAQSPCAAAPAVSDPDFSTHSGARHASA